MNEEEEEAPLEESRVCQNCLARERHAVRFEEQRAMNASQQAAQLFKTLYIYIYNILDVYMSGRPPWG
jgi:hypothetical protein